MPKLSLPDGKIEYRAIAPARTGAPTFVLLHEGLGSVAMWRDFPQTLAEFTGCGVLVYSRLGYGKSSPVGLPRPLDYMSREAIDILPRVLDELVDGDYFLLGHSDGASIAAIFAGHHHGVARNRGIILMAPHFFTEPKGLDSIAKAKIAYETTNLKERLARYHEDVDNAFYGWNGAWLADDFKAWNIEPYLPNIWVPVLVIQGENDEYGTLRQVKSAEKNCSFSVDVAILPDCGHSPHRDREKATLDAVKNFIDEAC